MSELIRDLTEAPHQISIDVEGHVSHEVILTVWAAFNPKETNTSLDLGPDWLKGIRRDTGDDLEDELVALGGPYCHVWLAVSGLLLSAPHPHDPDHIYEWLGSMPDSRLRRWILGYSSHSTDQALIEQVAGGDIEALGSLFPKDHKGMLAYSKDILFSDGLARRFADALIRFRSEVFSEYEEEFGDAIRRAAAARRAVPARGSAKEVVEDVTSGIDFEIPLGTSRVVLVPSVVTRPLSLIDEARGTLVVYYGIADEFLDSDPEAPPSWLVRIYKALSDDRRLRIMRRVSEGEATLDELTDLLGLSKSTVHHHISQLRAAGLIRVHVPSGESKGKQRVYTLREQALLDAGAFLGSYLKRSDLEERHVH